MNAAAGTLILLCLAAQSVATQLRPAANEQELRYWLGNMATHGFADVEMADVLGLSTNRISQLRREWAIAPQRATGTTLLLPYPGGRHPRIGFLDGAIDPQRDTKVSIFTPWDPGSYVVVDVPEAIFSNIGLIYLAHTHVPTIWTEKKMALQPTEWRRARDGSLSSARVLPNGIAFGTNVRPTTNGAVMELWLRNGTDKALTGLRVQNCVMLKHAAGFNAQTNVNKRLQAPYAATEAAGSRRWIITSWEKCQRTWANPPVPCMHSDPQIPDCPPGETRRVRGRLWFYEGDEVDAQFNLPPSGQQ